MFRGGNKNKVLPEPRKGQKGKGSKGAEEVCACIGKGIKPFWECELLKETKLKTRQGEGEEQRCT